MSYELVKIKPNSVVYCDIPYENTTNCYSNKFEYGKFYKWCKTIPFPVFISSYNIKKNDIYPLASFNKQNNFNKKQGNNVEKLYANRLGLELFKKQLKIKIT